MGESQQYMRDETLVELWIKTDDPSTLNEAWEIMLRYEDVRQYDDPLTYGRKRREAVSLETEGRRDGA